MHPNSLANLKPTQPGQVLNPTGRNGQNQRRAFLETVDRIMTEGDREELIATLLASGRNAEPWAMKLLVDRLWPAVAKLEIEEPEDPGAGEGAWEELSRKLEQIAERTQPDPLEPPPALLALREQLDGLIAEPILSTEEQRAKLIRAREILRTLEEVGAFDDAPV